MPIGELLYIPKINISPNNIIYYNEYIGVKRNGQHDNSRINLELSKIKADISKKAARRLYRAMDWMLLISKKNKAWNYRSQRTFEFKLAMITLTLPCEQLHSDLYVKKYLLNEFFTYLRKEYNIKNYIWKAEKQWNGNIHFHIVVDKFITIPDLKYYWNKILNSHGYIKKYRENQQEWHKDGFKVRDNLIKFWSVQSQIKAYKEGVKTNWQLPSSTTDIHSLRKIKNSRAYLAKYLTKNPESGKMFRKEAKEYQHNNNLTELSADHIVAIKEILSKKLHVEGNIWYISRSLSKLKSVNCVVENEIENELRRMECEFSDKILDLDRCRVLKFNIHEIFKYKFLNIFNKFKNYINELRAELYPVGEVQKNLIGLPLSIFDDF